MRKILAILLTLTVGLFTYGQQRTNTIDSLKNLLDNSTDILEKCDLLLKTAEAESELDATKARIYIDKVIELSEINNHKFCAGKAYHKLGDIKDKHNEFDSAAYFYEKAISFFNEPEGSREMAKICNKIGIIRESKGDFIGAFKLYMKALIYSEKIGDKEGIANAYLNIGLINHYRKNYKMALFDFNRALKIADEENLNAVKASAYNNMGMTYKLLKEYNKSINYFKIVLDLDRRENNKANIAYSLNNVGSVYYDLKDYQKAVYYYREAIKLKLEINDEEGLINGYNNLSAVLIYLSKFEEAKSCLEMAEQLTAKTGVRVYQTETFYNYHMLFKMKKEFDKALEYHTKYTLLNDSMQMNEKDLAIDQLQKQYDFDKVNADIELKNIQIEKSRQVKLFYLIALVVLVISLAFVLFTLTRIKNLNKELNIHQIEIQQQNETLRQKNLDIAKARQYAEDAAKSKGQFLSVMSHEIRTPLNAIIGIANLLNESEANPEQKRIIQILKSSSDNLMALINDILDVSKIESGKLHLEYVDFCLKEVVQNLHDLYLIRAKEKGVEFRMNFDPGLNQKLLGDPLRINQILSNLISNAIKFTLKGFIEINVKRVGEGSDYNDIHFEVKDSGIGIPSNKQTRIFDSFEQADNKTTRLYGGTGLGLSISKQLLELLGSDLLLKSTEGVGSSFYFTIRFNKVHPDTTEGKTDEKEILKQLEGKRILIAEDNPVNVYILKQFLGKWKMQAKIAEDGIKAVEMALNYNFDIVLMDINMPLIDGYEAANRILAIKEKLPIVAITAATLSETTDLMKESGIVDYIPKPFQPTELVQKILKNITKNQDDN